MGAHDPGDSKHSRTLPPCYVQTQNMGIRMGASRNPAMYKGTLDAFVRIAREEGVAGLYRWALVGGLSAVRKRRGVAQKQ